MHTTTSRDGTTIAYDRAGNGNPLVLVPGAFSYRRYPGQVKLAGLLAARFTVYSYDRRGRGDSGDTKPYAVEREIEDLAAVINAAGEHAHVWGLSSGAVLALEGPRPGCPFAGWPCTSHRSWSTPQTGGRRPTCSSRSPP
jgi:pimeloyl-ACP methyl ester carboxylesterase